MRYHAPPLPPSFPRGIPPPKTLQHVIIKDFGVSYDDLHSFGFTRLRTLEVHGRDFDATFALFLRLGSVAHTVSVQGPLITIRSQSAAADQGSTPRTVCVSFPVRKPADHDTVLDHPSIRDNIKTLYVCPESRWGHTIDPFALPSQVFPALKTFFLPVFSPYHPLFSLPDLEHCGRLQAPALQRLIIAYAPDSARYPIGPISPADLALFVARHLELGPGRALDELVLEAPEIWLTDTGGDCGLGLEVLESYVGTIRLMSADSIRTFA
ncbi:hypothetical protein AURDEDRAFT_173077 [Auricularia subglabra TFB-10046 SS5]|uniref:Uncharacterized protein n=1 Tax=Auricularia subglabra (strain TFB-10046 / SS5) TaxID=717982 RepID=J0WWN8_AURST|nr:hypothetical protein AURDEDRAFT_173077 [Auricularia subglabra TFB-10046 SS5]